MKLLEQLLNEMGGDTLKAFTVIPSFGGYFRSVKGVQELTSEKIVLRLKAELITLAGDKLSVANYFEEDILIRGDIREIKVER